MAKHSKQGVPSTGNGRTGGQKPARLQVTQQTSTGTTLWKQTAKLWGSRSK
jgi:hypothetical protein